MRFLLKTDCLGFRSDICDVVRLFYPDAEITLEDPYDFIIEHICIYENGTQTDTWTLSEDGVGVLRRNTRVSRGVEGDALTVKRLRKRAVKMALYELLKAHTGRRLPWGSLTGIRPTAVAYELMEHGGQIEDLTRIFDVSEEKTEIVRRILRLQRGLVEYEDDALDVYIGIPFCRTRCSYCSFAAVEIGRYAACASPYMDALEKEMRFTATLAAELRKRIRAVYIGGGTPTALDEPLFDRLMKLTAELFVSDGVEFTVEAGRPDTITAGKLTSMRAAGVGRVSINPQTMNDATLARVGRAHTAEDICRCFVAARELFPVINMDLIAGLPGENAGDFAATLKAVGELAPDNLTVHTLALKKGSALRQREEAYPPADEVERMLALAADFTVENGYEPYYLYRQKYMTGNFENVGYTRPGAVCRYNIDIMEETTSIAALGAGAISKRVYPTGGRIERSPDLRDVRLYIDGVDEMNERKRRLFTD
ncbi:MAG: coproporphyrinogen dehydrogenase HemZ [Eubacteriales bacterium]|nr:coproporphyrinogen dehydrogenase HemZ [Eubacteriales bacterium]